MSNEHLDELRRRIKESMSQKSKEPEPESFPEQTTPGLKEQNISSSPIVLDTPQESIPPQIQQEKDQVVPGSPNLAEDIQYPQILDDLPSEPVEPSKVIEAPLPKDDEYLQMLQKYNQKKAELQEIEESKKNRSRKRSSFPPAPKKKKRFEEDDEQQELMKWQKIVAQKEKQLDVNKLPLMEKEFPKEEMSLERVGQLKEEIKTLEDKIKNDTKEQFAEEMSVVVERKAIQEIALKKQEFELKKRALQSQINALNDIMSNFEREEMQHLSKIKMIENRVDTKKTEILGLKLRFEQVQYQISQWEIQKTLPTQNPTLNLFSKEKLIANKEHLGRLTTFGGHTLLKFELNEKIPKRAYSSWNAVFKLGPISDKKIQPRGDQIIDLENQPEQEETILVSIPKKFALERQNDRYFEQYQEFEELAKKEPHNIANWIAYATNLMRPDDIMESLSVLSKSLEQNRDCQDLWIFYLHLYLNPLNTNFDKAEARSLFDYAIQFCPECLVIWFMYEAYEVEIEKKIHILDLAITSFVGNSEYISCLLMEKCRVLCLSGDIKMARVVLFEKTVDGFHQANLALLSIAIQYFGFFPTQLEGIHLLTFCHCPIEILWDHKVEDIRSLFDVYFGSISQCLPLFLNLVSYCKIFQSKHQCLQSIQQVLSANSNMLEIWLEYIKMLELDGLDQANELFEVMLKKHPRSPLLWIEYILFCKRHSISMLGLEELDVFEVNSSFWYIYQIILNPKKKKLYQSALKHVQGADQVVFWREYLKCVQEDPIEFASVLTEFCSQPLNFYWRFEQIEQFPALNGLIPKYVNYEKWNPILLEFLVLVGHVFDHNVELLLRFLEKRVDKVLLRKALVDMPSGYLSILNYKKE